MTMPDETAVQTWSERNQRWLAERIAFWRERLSQRQTDAPAQMPTVTDPDFQPATMRVRDLFGLSAFETELLVLTAGIEIDAAFRAAVAQAQGMSPRETVRAELLAGAVAAAAAALGRHLAARSAAALVAGRSRHRAGVGAVRLRIDERILHYLTGVAAFDERLVGVAEWDEGPDDDAPSEVSARIAAS